MRGWSAFYAAALACAAAASFPAAAAPGAPEQLRCEGLVNPLGIDRPRPRLVADHDTGRFCKAADSFFAKAKFELMRAS